MQHIVKALFLRYGNFVEARTKIEQEYAGKLRWLSWWSNQGILIFKEIFSGNLIHFIQQSQLNDLHAGQTPPANVKNQQTWSNEIPRFRVFYIFRWTQGLFQLEGFLAWQNELRNRANVILPLLARGETASFISRPWNWGCWPPPHLGAPQLGRSWKQNFCK